MLVVFKFSPEHHTTKFQFILREKLTYLSNIMKIYPVVVKTFHSEPKVNLMATLGDVWRSPKWIDLILWGCQCLYKI